MIIEWSYLVKPLHCSSIPNDIVKISTGLQYASHIIFNSQCTLAPLPDTTTIVTVTVILFNVP